MARKYETFLKIGDYVGWSNRTEGYSDLQAYMSYYQGYVEDFTSKDGSRVLVRLKNGNEWNPTVKWAEEFVDILNSYQLTL